MTISFTTSNSNTTQFTNFSTLIIKKKIWSYLGLCSFKVVKKIMSMAAQKAAKKQ